MSKTAMLKYAVAFLVVAVLALTAGLLFAQAKGGGAGPATPAKAMVETVKIRKLIGMGGQCLVKTPEYRTSIVTLQQTQPQDWHQITVDYSLSTKDKDGKDRDWVDDLTFQYWVFTRSKDNKFSLFRATIRYYDVSANTLSATGKRHMSVVYLRPSAIERYGDVFAVAVEVSDGGVVMDSAHEENGLGKEWWKDQNVLGDKNVTTRDGYLVDRSLTPFALINIDDYEVTR